MRSWERGISLLRSVFFILQPSGFVFLRRFKREEGASQVRRYELYIRAIRTMEETKSIFPNLYFYLSTFPFFQSCHLISGFLLYQPSLLTEKQPRFLQRDRNSKMQQIKCEKWPIRWHSKSMNSDHLECFGECCQNSISRRNTNHV